METRSSTSPVRDKIIEQIKRYIVVHEMRAGDKMPSLREMARSMDVSLSAFREALHSLNASGMLNVVNGRGVFVVNPGMADTGADEEQRMAPEYVIDTINVRWLLEMEAVREIVRRSTAAQIEILGELANELVKRYQKGLDTHDEDKAFHLGLYGIVNNQPLNKVLSVMYHSWQVIWQYPMNIKRPFYDSAMEHYELYLALKRRDEERAIQICEQTRAAMLNSIREAAKDLYGDIPFK